MSECCVGKAICCQLSERLDDPMIYLSTFTAGFEDVVKNVLPSALRGSRVVEVYSGLIVYKYKGDPFDISKIMFFNNTFHLIRHFSGKKLTFGKMADEICSSRNDYLDRRIMKKRYGTFRVRFSRENRFAGVGITLASRAEREVVRSVGLKVNRLNPDTEFWYIIRSENTAFYAQLLFRRNYTEKNLKKGALRPELVHLMLNWAQLRPGDTVLDPFAGHGSIPLQVLKHYKFKTLIVNDISEEMAGYLKKLFSGYGKSSGVKIYCSDALHLDNIADKSVNRIITDPPWGLYEEIKEAETFYMQMLKSLQRVLKDDGLMLVLTARKSELEKAVTPNGLRIIDRIDTLVNGKKAALYKTVKASCD